MLCAGSELKSQLIEQSYMLNSELCNWLLQYSANTVQNPTQKTDTIIIYKGNQGCGKSIFVENFANNIIGETYSISTANPQRQILGNFNG